MPTATATARLEARISTDLHAMLKRAAELQGRTLADFVVSAVQDAAQRAIERAEIVRRRRLTHIKGPGDTGRRGCGKRRQAGLR